MSEELRLAWVRLISRRWSRWTISALVTATVLASTTSLADHPALNWMPRAIICGMLGCSANWILKLYAKLEEQNRDVTTSLYRRQWITRLTTKIRHEQRDVTVAIVDLNGLKAVNDQVSHAAGDEFLINAAHRLQSVLGRHRCCWVGRLGGDEFVVIARDSTTKQLAKEVREALHDIHPMTGLWGLGVGGVARTRHGDTKSAMKCADLAMIRAKREFRATGDSKVYAFDVALDGYPSVQEHQPAIQIRDQWLADCKTKSEATRGIIGVS